MSKQIYVHMKALGASFHLVYTLLHSLRLPLRYESSTAVRKPTSSSTLVGCSDGVHVGSAAEAVSEEQDVGIASWGGGKRSKIVHADCDAWAGGQRYGDDGPADCVS